MTKPTLTPFEAELLTHLPVLMGYARKLCRNAALADDLVQDAVVSALECREKYEMGTNMRAWLCTILFYDYTQTRRRLANRVTHCDVTETPISVEATQLQTVELHDALRAVEQLPKQFRSPLAMYVLDDASYEDIAKKHRISLGTAKSRLHRARARLAHV